MKNYKITVITLFLFNIILKGQQPAKLRVTENDTIPVQLHGWIAFKNFSNKEKNKKIYLLKGNDTLDIYNDKQDYSDGGIHGGKFWRAFHFDSVKLSSDLSIYVGKTSLNEDNEVFLFNAYLTKKLSMFTSSKLGYKCKLLNQYWSSPIAQKYYKNVSSNEIKHTTKKTKLSDIYGKLVYGNKKNLPLKNNRIYLTSATGDTIKKTTTNELGNFEFKNVNSENFNIYIPNTDKIEKENEIYLANQSGKIISTIKKSDNGFIYRLLPAEIVKLSEIEVDDPVLKINAFKNSTEKSITITENIYYPKNEFIVTPEIAKVLNVIVINLNENKNYNLEIISHTDALGDDNSNLELSRKRANAVLEYLVSKGIDKNRLKATGLGETKILNRCINNIICSEKEHEINRRTEFKYTK